MMWYLLLVVFTVSNAAVYDGSCPEPPAVENFNGTAWVSGVWYLLSMYADEPIMKGTCISGRETPTDDGFRVQKWYVANDVQNYLEGSLRMLPDANNSAKFNITFRFSGVDQTWPLRIIATDYTDLAVIYNCRYDETTDTHEVFPWIMAKTKTLDSAWKIAVDKVIENFSVLDAAKFVQNDFTDEACSFNSTVNLSI